jgi:hypothetical protein
VTLEQAREWVNAARAEGAKTVRLCDELLATTDSGTVQTLADELRQLGEQIARDGRTIRRLADNEEAA